MDEIDDTIKDIMKRDIEIPLNIENTIQNAVYREERTQNKTIKVAAMICIIIFLGTGGTIWAIMYNDTANKIYKDIQSLFVSESMKDMMQNGYIEHEATNFIYQKEIGIRIKEIVMSDHDLQFFLDIQSDKKSVKTLVAQNIFIYDENQNILVCYDRQRYEKFCKQYDLPIQDSIQSLEDGYSINTLIEEEYYKEDMYAIRTTKGFPKSKKLFIEIGWIIDEKTNRIVKGNWKFEIELPERFWQRENYSYILEEENKNFEILQAEVSQTQMLFEIREKEQGFDIQHAHITTENGEMYYISQHQGIIITETGENSKRVRFDINTDIASQTMQITGKDKEGKTVTFLIKREK